MKKFTKVVACAAVAASALAVGVFAGCANGGEKTGEAYASVHGGGYVGYAKVVKNGDKITDVTLSEVCLPTQVKAGDDVAEADKVGTCYKTVSYGNVTLTYDAAANDYTTNGTAFKTYLQSAKNAKAYYEAVVKGEISVTVGGEKKTDVMTNKALNKDLNGYWSVESNVGSSKVEGDYKWKANRDATVKYVKDNGVAKLGALSKNADGFWTDGDVVTGATWSDFYKGEGEKKGVYSTYAELILAAYNNAK